MVKPQIHTIDVSALVILKKFYLRTAILFAANSLWIMQTWESMYGPDEMKLITVLACAFLSFALFLGPSWPVILLSFFASAGNAVIATFANNWKPTEQLPNQWISPLLLLCCAALQVRVLYLAILYVFKVPSMHSLARFSYLVFPTKGRIVKFWQRRQTNTAKGRTKLSIEKGKAINRYTLYGIVIFVFGTAAGLALAILKEFAEWAVPDYVFTFLSMIMFYFGGRFLILGKRHSAKKASEVLRDDTRPMILFLRSFTDDMLPIKARWLVRTSYADNHQNTSSITFERVVVRQVEQYGPVVAVGKPGTSLPPLGAAREELSDETWQPQVQEWMMASQLIILVIGETAGVSWELERVISFGLLQKSIFLFPPLQGDSIANRWAKFLEHFMGFKPGEAVENLPSEGATAVTFHGQDATMVYSKSNDEYSYELIMRIANELVRKNALSIDNNSKALLAQ